MAVKIRLMRVGKTKQPSYRVVVADGRSPRDGRIIETIGVYGPRQDPSVVDIDSERALGWLRKGAQPSEQVQKLLTITGVWAEYQQGRAKPARTKLDRRGVPTGAGASKPKGTGPSKKAATAEAGAAAAGAAEPPVEEAGAPEPAAEEPDAPEPAPEAAADEPAAEEPAAEEPAAGGKDEAAG